MKAPRRLCAPIAALAAAALLGACGGGEPARPNLLLITVDTLRADRLGAWGYERATSPALDAWVESAVRFDDCQASSSWTLASLASLMTGLSTSAHGCWTYTSALDQEFVTLAEIMSEQGYTTAGVPSHVFLGSRFGLQQGFAEYDESLVMPGVTRSHKAISSPPVSQRGLRWLRQNADASEPWFLWLHYFDPHEDYNVHAGVSERFGVEQAEDRYDGEIAFTDRHIGRVLKALEEGGHHEDTIVVFVADHGEEWREHGRLGHGNTLYDEVTRIPLAISGPGLDPRVVEQSVGVVDVLPTLLELCDLPLRNELDGRSLVPLLEGGSREEQPILLELQLRKNTELAALVEGDWKLVLDRKSGAVELYDRAADPLEQLDRSMGEAERVERMLAVLERAVERSLGRRPNIGLTDGFFTDSGDLSDELYQAIDDLGYTDDGEDEDEEHGDD